MNYSKLFEGKSRSYLIGIYSNWRKRWLKVHDAYTVIDPETKKVVFINDKAMYLAKSICFRLDDILDIIFK